MTTVTESDIKDIKEHFEEILQRAKTEPDGVLIVQDSNPKFQIK